MTIQGVKKVLREILSEPGPNGSLSWGRVASSVALVASIIWVSKEIILTGHLPPMEGVTGFMISPYMANKATNAVQAFSGFQNNQIVQNLQNLERK